MYTHTINYNNHTYQFPLHLVNSVVHFESPITGELIEMTPPYSLNQYHSVLLRHVLKYA